MHYIALVLYMFLLLASRGPKDYEFRTYLAKAIVSVTQDPVEQVTLARLAWLEGGFRRNVARCETHAPGMVTEDHGKSFGSFQIQPMSGDDKKLACGSLEDQAGLALRYIRRSAEVCPKNKGAAALNVYTSGRCDYGLKASKERWGGSNWEIMKVAITADGR